MQLPVQYAPTRHRGIDEAIEEQPELPEVLDWQRQYVKKVKIRMNKKQRHWQRRVEEEEAKNHAQETEPDVKDRGENGVKKIDLEKFVKKASCRAGKKERRLNKMLASNAKLPKGIDTQGDEDKIEEKENSAVSGPIKKKSRDYTRPRKKKDKPVVPLATVQPRLIGPLYHSQRIGVAQLIKYTNLPHRMKSDIVFGNTKQEQWDRWEQYTPEKRAAVIEEYEELHGQISKGELKGHTHFPGLKPLRAFKTERGIVGVPQLNYLEQIPGGHVLNMFDQADPRQYIKIERPPVPTTGLSGAEQKRKRLVHDPSAEQPDDSEINSETGEGEEVDEEVGRVMLPMDSLALQQSELNNPDDEMDMDGETSAKTTLPTVKIFDMRWHGQIPYRKKQEKQRGESAHASVDSTKSLQLPKTVDGENKENNSPQEKNQCDAENELGDI